MKKHSASATVSGEDAARGKMGFWDVDCETEANDAGLQRRFCE